MTVATWIVRCLTSLSHKGFFFVIRTRKNSLVHIINSYEVPPRSNTVNDQMIVLGRSSDYLTDPYHLVEATDTKGNRLLLITNRFDISAEEIGIDIPRSRWEVELFFKHLKQQTTVKKFYSRDLNGLKNQLYVALIAQLLIYLIWLRSKSPLPSLTVIRYLLASL